MSTDQDRDSSDTSCCCSIMSWLTKVKELVQDPPNDTENHDKCPEAGKENELRMIAATSNGGRNGKEKPTRSRTSSSSSTNSYVVIERLKEEQEDVREKEGEHVNGSISPSDCSSVFSETTSGASQAPSKKLQCRTLSNIPVAMNNGTGIMHNEELLIGGGYTGGSSADDALLHTYNSNFDIWSLLPPAPLKWSALASLDKKVLLVGGKEVHVGRPRAGYTNKLCVLNEENKTWTIFKPHMQFARLSPVVYAYRGYLIVAGGRKGLLDYNVEIFDPTTKRWTTTTPLPHKCFKHTSTTIERMWYLLDVDSGHIYYTDILAFVKQSCDYNQQCSNDVLQAPSAEYPPPPATSVPPNKVLKSSNEQIRTTWSPLKSQAPFKPFRITSIGGHLLALSSAKGAVTAHAYMDGCWERVGKLPITSTTASMTVDSLGQLYLFGGEGSGGQYSFKLMKVSLVSRDEVKTTLHVGLDTAPFIIN